MTARRYIRKQISLQKHYLRYLPRLIDCSTVFGDGCYTEQDIVETEKRIQELEDRLDKIERP